MVDIYWNALQSPDIGGAFQQGFQQGQQRRREQAMDDAYRTLIANPGDPGAVNALARYAPREAYQLQGQQQQAERAAAEQLARIGAARGDAGALEELAGFNIDDYLKLDKRSQEEYKQGIDTIGQLALMADTPEEWDSVVSQLGPDFAQYLGRFDLRQSVIAQAGQAKQFIEQNQPRYQVIPEGGMLVNTRDPVALAQVGAGSQSAQVQPGENEVAPIIQRGMQTKIISPEELAAIEASQGPNGRAAARQWMQDQGIRVGRQIGGKTYVQRGGEWYEVN